MRNHRQCGFSLVELVVASTLFLALVLVVSSLAISGSDAQDLGRRIARMTEVAQSITDDMRLEMVAAVRVYGNDAEGNGMLGLLDLTRAPAPVGSRRLPTIDIDGPFRQDTPADAITGNAVLFAGLAWRDHFRCTSGRDYLVDVYRLEHYYLAPRDGGPARGVRGGLDLVRFTSEPLADASTVSAISDAVDRNEFCLHLVQRTADLSGQVHQKVEVVWNRTGNPTAAGTLQQIDEDDGTLSTAVLAGSGRPDPWRIL